MERLLALDLETTGFDPARDAIIEIGMVRMRDGEIVEEANQLVNIQSALCRNSSPN